MSIWPTGSYKEECHSTQTRETSKSQCHREDDGIYHLFGVTSAHLLAVAGFVIPRQERDDKNYQAKENDIEEMRNKNIEKYHKSQ